MLTELHHFRIFSSLSNNSFAFGFALAHNPQLRMPPRRPLTDLCLITVMKMLTPNDQLKAAKMSPRCSVLVRAANRRVKMLAITSPDDGKWTKHNFVSFSLASVASMKFLPAGGEPFPDYPMTTTRLSKWNCLWLDPNKLLDPPTIEYIVTVFSAVTDLKFSIHSNVSSKNLTALLQHPQLVNQLTSLAVYSPQSKPQLHRLFDAINRLSALQSLALRLSVGPEIPHLTIIARLRVIALDLFYSDSFSVCDAFLRSLERHAIGNVNLQVHLLGSEAFSSVCALSSPFRNSIIRYMSCDLNWAYDDVPLFCRQFPSLTTISVGCNETTQLGALFTALSTLPQLVHLELVLDWTGTLVEDQLEERQPLRRPVTPLPNVRALNLALSFINHSQLQWFSLPAALPRLQAIQLMNFKCVSCGVTLCGYSANSTPSSSTALECFRANFPQLYPGIPHDLIILGTSFTSPTLEQLLSAKL